MVQNNQQVTDAKFTYLQNVCRLRDLHYTTKFYNQPFFQVVKPLFETIRADGAISCFIGDIQKPLAEAAATCLLVLSRLKLLDDVSLKHVQEYLLNTNAEVVRFEATDKTFDASALNIDNCAWSADQGKNVWSTGQIVWALIASHYDGIYRPVIIGAIEWLLEQQYKAGGWALIAGKENQPNVFVTSMTVYVLKLSLQYEKWEDAKQWRIKEAIKNGCKYIVENRSSGKKYWSYDPNQQTGNIIEPTTTAMAIWALHHCAPDLRDVKEIVQDGIRELKRNLSGKYLWDNMIALDGLIPETQMQQVLQGFTPSIVLILLRLGVNPLDDVIVKPINLILNMKGDRGWDFYTTAKQPKSAAGFIKPEVHYVGAGLPMTFTTALALWSVEEWHKRLVKENLSVQKEVGHLQLRLQPRSGYLVVQPPHLAILLILSGIGILTLYFTMLDKIFHQSLLTLFVNFSVLDVSNLFDSITELLFVPIVVIALLINFYRYGKFSFTLIRDIWKRLF